jgi:hypothetical protein
MVSAFAAVLFLVAAFVLYTLWADEKTLREWTQKEWERTQALVQDACDQRDAASARWNEAAQDRDKAVVAYYELKRRWDKVVKYMNAEPKGN